MVRKLIILLLVIPCPLQARENFEDWFTSGSMRVDYLLAGDKDSSGIYLYKIYKEPYYSGPLEHINEPAKDGNYYFEVKDSLTGQLLYSKGFSTLFGEWQTTDEAIANRKAFKETIRFPYPRKTVQVDIYSRPSAGISDKKFTCFINPDDILIEKINPAENDVIDITVTGDSHSRVDLLYIAEGYTGDERDEFLADVHRFNETMFRTAPFDMNRNRFNIRAVFAVSKDEGTDNPGKGEWKNTAVHSNFYTFYSERYLTTTEYWRLMDIAAAAPRDQVIVLVNAGKYGGGGIFNHYCLFSAGNASSEQVFIHEFGHSFAGLGDEYYTSSVSYSDYYDLTKEPWEPNLTTLIDFDRKWKKMVSPGIPVPTPEKDEYKDKVGVFEGGGYMAEGIYRPQLDCRMKSNRAKGFCQVCLKAIREKISYYSGQDTGPLK